MRRITFALVLIAFGLSAANAADSDDVTVVGGLDFGFKKLQLDTRSTGDSFTPSFTTINPSIVLGYQSFYTSLSYDRSISADHDIGRDPSGLPFTTDYEREDITLTLGYRLNQSFSLFAGYTEGKNQFFLESPIVVITGRKIEYKESGPFAGIAYSATFGNKGTLGLSVAYAELDGELKTTAFPSGASNESSGDTTGFSYGLSWSGPLTGSMGYRVGVKRTEYDMDDPVQINERYTSFFLGISNYF